MRYGTTYIVRPVIAPSKSGQTRSLGVVTRHPVVVRAGVLGSLGADEGQMLGARDILRVAAVEVAARVRVLVQARSVPSSSISPIRRSFSCLAPVAPDDVLRTRGIGPRPPRPTAPRTSIYMCSSSLRPADRYLRALRRWLRLPRHRARSRQTLVESDHNYLTARERRCGSPDRPAPRHRETRNASLSPTSSIASRRPADGGSASRS